MQIPEEVPDQILPAMPIRIRHYAAYANYELETKGGEPVFRVSYPKATDPKMELGVCRDPYVLSKHLEGLRSPGDALKFLRIAGGRFRLLRRDIQDADSLLLSWRELLGWQEIVWRLRRLSGWFPLLAWSATSYLESCETVLGSDAAAIMKKHAKKAFTESYCEAFGAGLDHLADLIWRVSDDTCHLLQGTPPTLSVQRDIYLSQAEIRETLSDYPGSDVHGSREWHYAQSALKHRQLDKASDTPGLKPTLVAEISTGTALDAILATVYVDKLRGIEWQVCALKKCTVTFEKTSDSRRLYCSQQHANTASHKRKRDDLRREREEARKALKPTKTRKAS